MKYFFVVFQVLKCSDICKSQVGEVLDTNRRISDSAKL